MSPMIDRLFHALSSKELSDLRADIARLTRERDVYLESLQHVQERADQLTEKNRELARLLPVAVAAHEAVKCLEALTHNSRFRTTCAGAIDTLEKAVEEVKDLVRAERDRRFPTRP